MFRKEDWITAIRQYPTSTIVGWALSAVLGLIAAQVAKVIGIPALDQLEWQALTGLGYIIIFFASSFLFILLFGAARWSMGGLDLPTREHFGFGGRPRSETKPVSAGPSSSGSYASAESATLIVEKLWVGEFDGFTGPLGDATASQGRVRMFRIDVRNSSHTEWARSCSATLCALDVWRDGNWKVVGLVGQPRLRWVSPRSNWEPVDIEPSGTNTVDVFSTDSTQNRVIVKWMPAFIENENLLLGQGHGTFRLGVKVLPSSGKSAYAHVYVEWTGDWSTATARLEGADNLRPSPSLSAGAPTPTTNAPITIEIRQMIQPSSAPRHRLSGAYIKFALRGTVNIEESHNVSSVTDHGTNWFTINFEEGFKTSRLACTPVGTTPRNFRVLEVSRGSITVLFEGDEPHDIALWIEDIGKPSIILPSN